MANVDNPNGFRPVHYQGMRGPTKYRIQGSEGTPYATALYIGDPVALSGGYVIKATAGTGNILLGMISHFENRDSGLSGGGYYPASSSDDWYVYVWDDPHMRFIAQDDGVGNDIALTDIGNTGNIILTHGGNTSTNLSGAEIDGSSMDTGQAVTDQLILVDLVDMPGNAIGDNAQWVVGIHNHFYRQENNVDATT